MKKIIIRHVKSFFTAVGVFITLHAILNLIFERPRFDTYDNVSWIVGLVLLSAWLMVANCVEWKKTGKDTFLKEVKPEQNNSKKRVLVKNMQMLFVCIGVCIVGNLGLSVVCENITFTALDCIKLVAGVTVIILAFSIYKMIGNESGKEII
ncbi:MAG: hypothetical protein IJO60_05515 [Agathobacter sp.]|nr:hypothetical protein [Agathobacter sp.]